MNPDQVKEQIDKRIVVTHHTLATAVAFMEANGRGSTSESQKLVNSFCAEMGSKEPPEVRWGSGIDPEAAIEAAASYLSAWLSAVEAIWALLNQGYFLPVSDCASVIPHLRYRTDGQSGGWNFWSDLRIPSQVCLAPSVRYNGQSRIFMRPNDIILPIARGKADPEIIEAVQDALDCFQKHLFRPTVVMLGKAAEGAWAEVGISLSNKLRESKMGDQIKQGDIKFVTLVKNASNLYSRKELEELRKGAGVSPEQLAESAQWTSLVREARNAIHFGYKPTVPNTYEKVALLLLDGVTQFDRLYRIKVAGMTS